MHDNLLEVFNERDSVRRRATIERTYADDIRWTDDDGVPWLGIRCGNRARRRHRRVLHRAYG